MRLARFGGLLLISILALGAGLTGCGPDEQTRQLPIIQEVVGPDEALSPGQTANLAVWAHVTGQQAATVDTGGAGGADAGGMGGPEGSLSDGLTAGWSIDGEGWQITGEGAAATVTAPGTYDSEATVTVTVSNQEGQSASAELTVMTGQNIAPMVADISATPNPADPESPVDLSVDASDENGDELTYRWTGPDGWSFDDATAADTTVTTPDQGGSFADLKVTVSDGFGRQATASIRVEIAANTPPNISSVTATPPQIAPGGSITLEALATDAEQQDLTYSWQLPSGWTAPSTEGSSIDVTAPSSYGASASAKVTVTDTKGASATGSVTISTQSNDGPVIAALDATPKSVAKGEKIALKVDASDPNGDTLSYSWSVDDAQNWTLSPNGETAQLTSPMTPGASTSVTVEVSDGQGTSATASTVVSTQPNRPPNLASVSASPVLIPRGGTSTVSAQAADPNGDSLSYSWTIPSDWTMSGSGDQIQVTAPNRPGASATIQVSVTDGFGGKATGSATVQTKLNDLPTITSLTANPTEVPARGQIDLQAVAQDGDNDPLSYSWTVPSNWTKNGSGDQISVTAPDTYGRSDTVTLEVDDGFDTVTKTITVKTVANKPPTVSTMAADANPVLQNAETAVTVQAGDPYGDPLSYSWSLDNADWSFSGSGDSVTLSAPDDGSSSVDVTVTVDDGHGGTVSETLTVTTQACPANTSNCDGMASNGCEANLAADEDNCGGCGNVCQNNRVCIQSTCRDTNALMHLDFESGSGTATNKGTVGGGLSGAPQGNIAYSGDAKLGNHSLQSPSGSTESDRLDLQGMISSLDMSSAYTAMAWIKVNSGNNQGLLILGSCCSPRQGYTLNLDGGELRWWAGSDNDDNNYNMYSPSPLPQGTWVHVGVRADGGTAELMVDGNVVDTNTSNVPTSPSQADSQNDYGEGAPQIGGEGISSVNGADVLIDEVRVYDTRLTDTQYNQAMQGQY